jgi:hypothetical protein
MTLLRRHIERRKTKREGREAGIIALSADIGLGEQIKTTSHLSNSFFA